MTRTTSVSPAPDHATVTRLTWLLFFSQSIGSAGFIAGSTVGALIGQQLTGDTRLTGVPGAVYLVGSALAAYLAARLMERTGRRLGLAAGYAIGILGALLSGLAVLVQSFPLFLFGFVWLGVSRGFNDLARYAAAEMRPASERGRAISLVVLGGTVGAILGPQLVPPMGQLMETLHADPLAGPWFSSAVLFGLGLLLIGLFLRPDPSAIARQLPAEAELVSVGGPLRPLAEILRQAGVQAAIAALVLGQVVMVMLMAITSVHMNHHGHSLGDISLVITAHTLGMYGPSLVSGRLTDRWGRARVIALGALILIAACVLAPLSQNTWVIALALLLLGIGWNFCYVAGGALLTDSLTPGERARGQGGVDLLINVVSASGSLGSGLVFASLGYTLMGAVGLIVTLVPLALAARLMLGSARADAAPALNPHIEEMP
jgi:MFS family permease